MDVLYFQQTELAESIRKILVNFKKDSSDRKTIEYGKTRLDLLDSHWREYEHNHEKCIPLENRGHKYFVDSEFERTKESYLEGKSTILKYFEELGQEGKLASQAEAGPSRGKEQQRPRTPAPPAPPSAAAYRGSQVEERGIASKVDAMLRRQRINFKAFVRTVDGMDLESFREKWEYEDALRVLQSRWAVVDHCHWEIMLELEEDEAYEYNYNKHERTYNGLRKAISSRMWSTSYRDKTTPQMDIPVFSGNFQQWVSFKDLFDEAIHNNPSLSNAQKMQFLKGKVKGEAERLIQHLPISTGNYTTCWEILIHRFDNKRSIFNSYANTIYNLANIQQQSFAAIKRLHDVTLESLHAIKNLGIDTTSWDPLLVYILSQKLDNESYSEYMESLKNTRELPVLQEFLDFLENKFTALESSRRRQDGTNKTASSQQQTSTFTSRKFKKPFTETKNNNRYEVTKSLHVSESAIKCPHCNSDHRLINCKKFLESNDEQKIFILNKLDFCKNCIYDHVGGKCFSTKRCHKCNDKHHTILHDYFATQSKPTFNSDKGSRQIKEREHHSSNNINVSHQDEPSEILLATALVKVTAADNTQHVMRALIDQGSQVSVISERAAQQLGLKRENCKGVICGVGERESICKGKLKITCQSTYTDFKFTTNALILSNMIKNLPNKTFPKPSWDHLAHIRLADPDFNISRPVDLLLGAEVYSNIIMEGIIRGQAKPEPLAQQTQLGWMLCGGVKTSFQCNVILDNIEDIHQFWKIEDIQEQNEMSVEDQECLDYYKATTKRLDSGRYEVRLPMKPEMKEKLGSSKEIAIAQFKNLERKLVKNESLSKQYKLFISEYEQLKHMKLATSDSIHRAEIECFLPHHAVLKEDSVTTKLRVVFNASAKTSSGHSLNDLMHKGPNLQQDLLEIILKWRQYRFAYTADIEKCFRMILVNEQDQYLQQIIWRAHESQPIRAYKLSTITYGTKSAPFLTMMTLRRLAEDEQLNFPNAAKCINEELYMDDWVSGADSIEEGKKRIEEMNACLKSGGFLLRKWSSNDKQLLEKVEKSNSNQPPLFTFKTESTAKTLGIQWDSTEDKFTFQCDLANTETTKLTKRMLLSEISKIFDPLGWLAPLITKLKLLFQQVWQNSEAQWSDEVAPKVKEEWSQLKKDINIINQIKIPRWLKSKKGDVIELHGFCDASTKAFACVVYARIVTNESASVVLTAAKTRLVPSSKAVTLPRLELCAAELLTNLMTKIVKSITSFTVVTYGWSDSKVTLSWIQGSPERWKPFIANRVKKITSTMPPKSWHYINTKENPADAASRGLTSTQLIEHKLWWQGPTFLSVPNFELKEQNMTFSTNEEVRKLGNVVSNVISDSSSIIEDLLDRYSSFTKVIRIFAWIRRVLTPIVCKQRQPMYLMLPELRSAKLIIIKHIQQIEFKEDIECLLLNKNVNSQSKIANLNPFLDEEGILRAKGRLRNANISTEMKFPIIISYSGRLTELLIEQAHELTFHGGPRLTMSLLRQRYWIVKGNRAVKKQLLKCVTCRKQAPVKLQQIMGDLPDFRTNPAPAFYHTGVDLTGFIPVKANKGRGIKTTKGYVVLFIRMVTKAVHIELVSDLTSVSFIAALRRMAARRGAPKHMYSDNGTNFVGANKILQEEYQQLEEVFKESFHREITELNIEWHWNCPSWPSAGGIWERSIRSLKQHLKRVVGEQALTFEEYSTVLARIEASLNSRPLCPISEDIEDIGFLTPAHFLTSNAGLTVIETTNDARTRWHLTNKIFQDLWKRWKNQTSVVEAEYNVLKRTEQAIQSQHKLINKHLNYLAQTTKQFQKEFESMSTIQEFTLAAMATTNMIRNLKQIQDTLIDTLTDIYHGKINLHLLTPKQLNDELQIVSSHVSKELTLPVDNIQINLYKIYQLLKVKARMSRDYVIFEISLPLISRDSFHLYHLIPVPLQIDSDMISISLVTDFIATNLMRDSYIPISSIDLQGCEYQDETFFCQLQGPVKHLSPEEKFCQIEQIDTCKIKRESCKNKWVQLHNPSFYLYFACDTYSLTIICDNETRVRRVSKAGLIQLYKQCTAKGRDVTLYSYLQQHTLTLKPDLVLTNIAPIQHHTFNTTLPLVEPFQDKYLNTSLQQLGDQINAMKEAAQQEGTLTTHDVHQYAISYSVLAAGVLVFLWFLWRRYRQAAVSSTPAAPASGVAPQRDYAPPPPPLAPVPPREAPSSSESVSARNESVTEPECSVTGAVRWSSLRKKHNKQSVFTIDRD